MHLVLALCLQPFDASVSGLGGPLTLWCVEVITKAATTLHNSCTHHVLSCAGWASGIGYWVG